MVNDVNDESETFIISLFNSYVVFQGIDPSFWDSAPVLSFVMANIHFQFPESLWIAFLSGVIFHKHTWKPFRLPHLLTHTSPQLSLQLYRETKKTVWVVWK